MSQTTTKKVGEVGERVANNNLQFNLVTSIRAGCAHNQTLLADTIQITPVDEPGILELYCKNVTETIVSTDNELSYGIYELRWTSKKESFGSQPIVFLLLLLIKRSRLLTLLMSMNSFGYHCLGSIIGLVYRSGVSCNLPSSQEESPRRSIPLFLLVSGMSILRV